ncbi:RHS repeat-associated core domain-containing protein [Dokdonella sp.]|uniref:RHS repeat-associated core domain-containing protein n=1 Tax=Dokdonella sp. TaxID=2291710 RepID=UPI0027BB191A|nr:RHS repeat-associated core domain-containing protein [Dokdonella sp.]
MIERTYAGFWVTVEVLSDNVLVYGPFGAPMACNIPGYSDPDTGQCGPPKCTGACCGDCGGGPNAGGGPNGDSGTNGSNPIHTAAGNKYQRETDFIGAGVFPLRMERYYNSNRIGSNEPVPMGIGWSHTWQRRVVAYPTTSGGALSQASVYRHDGRLLKFTLSGSVWLPDPDVVERLSVQYGGPAVVGWTLTSANDEVEQYDGEGRLLSITARDGFKQTLSYLDSGNHPRDNVQKVIDPEGRSLAFAYDANGRIASITSGDGQVINYGYAGDDLGTVTYPDLVGTRTRTYYYNEVGQTGGVSQPHLLTGIEDENNQRFASWGYTSDGRANLSVHGPFATGSIDRTVFAYNANGTTTVTDALNQSRVYGFDVKFGVARIDALDQPCDECGRPAKSQTYDANGYTDLVTDFRDVQTDYDFNARGLQTRRIEAVGTAQERTITTTWDAAFRVPLSIVEPGRTTAFVLNARGQVTTRTISDTRSPPPVGGNEQPRVWTYVYCDGVNLAAPDPIGAGENLQKGCPLVGLLRRIDGPRTDVADRTTYEYRLADAAGATPAFRKGDAWRTINALGQVTEILARDGVGRIVRSKDANGTLTDLTYHPRGWLTSRTIRALASGLPSADDAIQQYAYDGVGNLVRATQADNVYLEYHYDIAHRLDRITDASGNYIQYTLDAKGHRLAENTYANGNPAPMRSIARVWNTLSRLEMEYPHDPLGLGRHFLYGYDGNGNRIDSTDPLDVQTHSAFDALNRLQTLSADHLGSDPSTADATTQYGYDARDNLISVTDPELLQTSYTHDGLNNLDALSSPDTGAASYSQDAAGNRSSQTDARGITSTYSHDALNRLTSIAYPTASLDVTYQYDQPDSTTGCVGSFPQGRLTRMIDSAATTVYCYDRRGNLTRKLQDHGGVKKTTAYTWTRADRLESLSYPSGGLAGYTYDAVGRVAGVTWSLGGKTTTVLASIAWYPFGPARVLTYGNGRTSTRSYDANYAIDSIVGSPAGGLTLDYDSDILGNLVGLSAAAGANPPDRVYDYDALYRLTQVHAGANLLESYTYTPTGDRASALTSAGTQMYAYEPGSHRLSSVGGVSRAYDANGNTTSGIVAGITQEYDQRNRLIRVRKGGSAMHYFHNGRGERVVKAVKGLDFGAAANEHYYIYDQGGTMLGDYQPGILQRELIYLAEQPVGVVTQVGKAMPKLSYVEPDHLGTPRSVIDPATNQALWKWDLRGNAFGNDAPNDDPDGNGQAFGFDWRFPGQYRDAETGLSYNYFRDYEPGTGRYIESDPIGLDGGIDTYGYSYQNPTNVIDPTGLDGWECRRPLGKPPGTKGPAVFNHQYLCVTRTDGTIECGSQTTDGNGLFSPGRPTRPDEDYYNEGSCEKVDDDKDRCYERCVLHNFQKKRPVYGIGPQGTDCQEWSDTVNVGCKLFCGKNSKSREGFFSGVR